MSKELQQLLEAARSLKPAPEEDERQRRSFAYGNAKIENDRITREMVDRQAKLLEAEKR